MDDVRKKALKLISKHGYKGAHRIAYEIINEIGWLALTAPTKEVSDDYKIVRFQWDVIAEIIKKEQDGNREDI